MTARARSIEGFPLKIVGESHYVEDFVALFGERRPDGIDRESSVTLEYEDDNPHDPLAVVVRMEGRIVGYLSAIDARLFRQSMTQCGCAERSLVCAARVRGGWDDGCGDTGNFGVTLALDIDRPVE